MSPTHKYLIFRDYGISLAPTYAFFGPRIEIVKESLPLMRQNGHWFGLNGPGVVIQEPELATPNIYYFQTQFQLTTMKIEYILNCFYPELNVWEYFEPENMRLIEV